MIKFDSVKELLDAEISRKEFLQFAGAGILGIIGFTSFISNLEKFVKTKSSKDVSSLGSGYGSGGYGR